MVDAAYEELANGFVASGRSTRDASTSVVNEEPYLTPRRLKEIGWVDMLGRWEDMEKAVVAARGPRRARSGLRAPRRAALAARRDVGTAPDDRARLPRGRMRHGHGDPGPRHRRKR